MTTRTRRTLAFVASMVGAWTVASFIAAELVRPELEASAQLNPVSLIPSDAIGWRLARALASGLTAGLLASLVELRLLPGHARRRSVGTMLLFRTVAYAIVFLVAVVSTARFIARRELRVPVEQVFTSPAFRAFVTSPDFVRYLVLMLIASFVINAAFQIGRLLGPGTTKQILLGRYIRPLLEDRVFMFVDLADSTAIAERLGPVRFAEFKNDFFHDMAEPVLDTHGQIVQYVGDEVLLTWPRGGRRGAADSVRCFFLLRDQVRRQEGLYRERYGEAPRFRAGLHGGEVVVSQLGDVKREIVFSGDPVNTAARIQSLCRELDSDFLASEDVLRAVSLPEAVHATELGDHGLRGRSEPVRLVALA